MRRVYFIKPIGMDGPIKIGCSAAPERRREGLELWCPIPLEIIAEIEGDRQLERRFHSRFLGCYIRHEWFNATPELVETIAAIRAGIFDLTTLPPPQHLPRKPKGPWTEAQKSAASDLHLARHQARRVLATQQAAA